jgi:two-component system OmpR family sensor kinase
MNSIRRQLLASLLASITLALLLAAFGTYRLARQEIDAVFDYHLRQLGLSLRDQVFGDTRAPLGPDDAEFDFTIQVWSQDGARIYLSHPHTVLPNRAQLGFSDVETPEGRWRVFATAYRQQVMQVAQPMRVRERLAATAALQTLLPFVVLLPLLAGTIWWVVGRGLAPLDRIAGSVRRRTPSALEPLRTAGVPAEALPLVTALNDLLVRLDGALSAQRAFVADAAHELRTPLTALRLQVQLTERAGSDVERAAALAELRAGLERATHVVQQLLTLARQDPADAPKLPLGPVSLAELAAGVAADHAGLATARGIDLGITASDSAAVVQGNADALRTLVANLVDNAVRYTPAGGQVDLAVGVCAGAPWVSVSDSGPGIPAGDREHVFDRFYRRHETPEPGSGLGLAIVKAVADRHGATVELDDADLGGLSVRVRFPA